MEKQSQSQYIPIKYYWSEAEEIKQKYKLNFDIKPYLISKEQCDIICKRYDYYEKGSSDFYPHSLNVKRAREEGFTTEQTLFLNLLKTPTGIDFKFIKEQVKARNDNFFKIPLMDKQTFFHSAIAYDQSDDILPILNEIKEKCDKENKKLADYIDFERQDENYGVRKNILQLALIKTYIYNIGHYTKGVNEEIHYREEIVKKDQQERVKKDQQVIEFLIENSTKGALINKDSEGYNILDYAIYRMDIQNLKKIIERAKKDEFVYELIANSKLVEGTEKIEDLITIINKIEQGLQSVEFCDKRYSPSPVVFDNKSPVNNLKRMIKTMEINFGRMKENLSSLQDVFRNIQGRSNIFATKKTAQDRIDLTLSQGTSFREMDEQKRCHIKEQLKDWKQSEENLLKDLRQSSQNLLNYETYLKEIKEFSNEITKTTTSSTLYKQCEDFKPKLEKWISDMTEYQKKIDDITETISLFSQYILIYHRVFNKDNQLNIEEAFTPYLQEYQKIYSLDDFLEFIEGSKLFYNNKKEIISFFKQRKTTFLDFFQQHKKIQTAIEIYQLKQSLNTKNKEITKLKRQFYKKLPQMLYKNDKIDKRMKKRKQISQKEKELKNLKSKIEKIDKQNFDL